MDMTVQWLMEIRRTLECVGWRLLVASLPESEEPFAEAVGEQVRYITRRRPDTPRCSAIVLIRPPRPPAKAKRSMSDAVSALVAPIRGVAPLLYPLASYTTLGAILGTVGFMLGVDCVCARSSLDEL